MRAPPRLQVVVSLLLAVSVLGIVWTAHPVTTDATAAPPAATSTPPHHTPPDPDYAQRLLELINKARWEHQRIPPLKANDSLQRSAQTHSQSMALNDFFGHKGADMSSPWDRIDAAGYGNWHILAENIAAGYQAPERVVKAWMESPSHRTNLLNADLREAGVGHFYQTNDTYPGGTWGYGHYWTLDMGSRWDNFPLVISGEAFSTTTRLVSLYLYGEGWAADIRLSNDGTTWSEWQPYRSTLYWDLPPGNGIKTVYAQLRDAQGNHMQSSDEIFLEEASPPPATPALLVYPTQVIFVAQARSIRGHPSQYGIQITDRHGQFRTWRASSNQSWLHSSASTGTTPSQLDLTLSNRIYFLSPGVYTGTLSLQGENVQAEVTVLLFILPQVYSLYLPFLNR